MELAVLVVDAVLPERLGDPLRDPAVHLAVDDHRVDDLADVVDGDVALERRPRRSPRSISTMAMCVPKGNVQFGGS